MNQLLGLPRYAKAILLLLCVGGFLILVPGFLPFVEKFISEKNVNDGYQTVKITLRDKNNEEKIPDVTVDIETDGPPDPLKSDSNGYFELRIPARESAKIFLSKPGYRNEKYVVNLQTNPDTTKTFHMNRVSDPEMPSKNIGGAETPHRSSESSTNDALEEENTEVSKQSSDASTPKIFQGEWIANLNIPDLKNSTVRVVPHRITLTEGSIGEKVGIRKSLHYPYCESSLILRQTKLDSIELFDGVVSGGCITDGKILLTLIGKDIMDYSWSHKDYEKNVTGKLTRK